jgi:hypothetical protein
MNLGHTGFTTIGRESKVMENVTTLSLRKKANQSPDPENKYTAITGNVH